MNIVDRIKNILLTPKTEWDVIAAETTPTNTIVMGYVLPLAAVAAIAGFIGICIVGMGGIFGGYRMGFVMGLVMAIFQVVMSVVMVFVLAFIIDMLAPNFGSQKNMPQAIKVAAYAYTPVWVLSIVKIIPMLGILVLLAALYAIYLLYLGLAGVMKSPPDKVTAYTAVVVVVGVIVSIVIGAIGGVIAAGSMGVGGMMGAGMGSRTAPGITYDSNSPMGKLNDFSAKMQEQGKKMEAAQKSGDQKAQMAAAMGALGTAISGGKGVDPVQIDALKPFVPATFAGMPQTSTQSERGGVQGLMTAKVEARYGDSSGKNAELEVTDTGGAAGLLGLASWMGVQGEREDDSHREVTRKDGNRLIHEEMSKRGGSNKFSVVLNDRFVVSARGNVDFDALKSSVASLDLGKLEALK